MSIEDNFMEEALFQERLRAEYEYRMWQHYVEEKEAEEQAYLSQAEQYFKDLEEMEQSAMMEDYSYGI